MHNNFSINKKVLVFNFSNKLSFAIQYCSQQRGNIKGIKTSPNHDDLFLIEFLNHNRIWAFAHEIKTCYQDF